MDNNFELLGDKYHSISDHVADQIRSQITSNNIRPGDKLPPIRELSKAFGVGNYSIRQAFAKLSKEGVLETIRGSGTFVTNRPLDKEGLEGIEKPRAFCIVSAFRANEMQVELRHPVTLSAILDECKAIGVKGRLLSPNIDILSFEDVLEELKDRSYNGVIWMYPTDEHWVVIRALTDAGIPVAVTCHSQYPVDIPAVQGDEVGAGQIIGKYLAKQKAKKIVILSYEFDDSGDIRDIRSGLHIGMRIGLLNAFEVAGLDVPELVFVKYTQDNYSSKLAEACKQTDADTALMIANNKEFRSLLEKDFSNTLSILQGLELIIFTSKIEYPALEELTDKIDFSIQMVPLDRIGRAVVHKLNNTLDGKFEDTITLVNGVFERTDSL